MQPQYNKGSTAGRWAETTATNDKVLRFDLRLRDNDGEWVTAGDTVHFTYGMPPAGVAAPIIERDGKLIGLCPGHNPPEFNLRSLRRYVGTWHKKNAPHESQRDRKDET